jgi:predicted negative regulator of RcsB-dependent stress response
VRFRLLGTPIRIHPTWWLVVLALGANLAPQPLSALIWLATVLVVLLAGELAVARGLRSLGYAPTVWLHWVGAETSVAVARPKPARDLCAAYAGGPLVVLMLAGALAALARLWPSPYVHDAVRVAAFWGVASLVPIRPLLGGKILHALLVRPLKHRAELATRVLGIVLTVGALWLLLSYAWSFPAFLLVLILLWVNVWSLRQDRLARSDQRAAAELQEGWAAIQSKDWARAKQIGEKLTRETQSVKWKALARELTAWAHLCAGELGSAAGILERMPPGTDPDPLLEGSLYLAKKEWAHAATLLADAVVKHENDDTLSRLAHALIQDRRLEEALALGDKPFAAGKTFDQLVAALFYAKRLDEARALGLRWWALEKHPRLAFNLACIEARSGKPDEACRWLDEAVGAGWRDLRLLDEDPDLEPLRKLPAFHQARARLTSLGRVSG